MVSVPTHFNFVRDVLGKWSRRRPDALALWCVDETGGHQHKFTFGQLAEQARRAGTLFHRLGIRRRDRVLVVMPRVPQWWIGMLGLVRIGAVPIPSTPQLTAQDIEYRIKSASVKAIVTDPAGAAKVADFDRIRILVGDPPSGWVDFDHGVRDADELYQPRRTRADAPGIIYFTSGTTGPQKMGATHPRQLRHGPSPDRRTVAGPQAR